MSEKTVIVAAVVLAAVFGWMLLAGPDQGELEDVAQAWFRALQAHDLEELARYDAAAPAEREGALYDAWYSEVEAAIRRYETGRDVGRFDPDPTGYAIARASMLGGGTFWETLDARRVSGELVLRIKLNFGYGEVYYDALPRGTTAYLLSHPLGTVTPIVVGSGETYQFDVLEHVELVVHLVQAPHRGEDEPAYKVSRVEWDPDSVEHGVVSWIF